MASVGREGERKRLAELLDGIGERGVVGHGAPAVAAFGGGRGDRGVCRLGHCFFLSAWRSAPPFSPARARRHAHGVRPPDQDIDFTFDARKLPHMAAIGDRWPLRASRDTYTEGLRAFVNGLLA